MSTWAPGITAIMQADLGATPASINRETGVMLVNPKYKLNADQWYFIMLHELGHLKMKTKNELEADRWAHEQYMKEGRSLKQSVFALTDLLTYNKPEDMQRAYAQLQRAQEKDGNQNFAGQIPCHKSEFNNHWMPYGLSNYDSRYNEYFLGGVGDWLSKNATAIGSAVGGFVNAKKSSNVSSSSSGPSAAELAAEAERQRLAAEQKRKQTTMIVIGAAVTIVVLIVVVVFVIKRKK